MFFTVTFNPALDYIIAVDGFSPGRINRASSEALQMGGKGINVSAMLKALGTPSVALGFTAGRIGDVLEAGLRDLGIETDFIRLPEGNTRINVKIRSETETELNGEGPPPSRPHIDALMGKIRKMSDGDGLALSGNVQRGVDPGIYAEALDAVGGKRVLSCVDAAGELLSLALPRRPFLIKPNLLELEGISGGAINGDRAVLDAARRVQGMGARNVLVSMAGDGALLACESGRAWRVAAVPGEVRNSVGAGDSMVAGFLHCFGETGDFAAALRLGAAAGTATAFSTVVADRATVEGILARSPEPLEI
ncbi:MAG: 1-phosphofructokinase family hexose kinase [Deltaproteobacteria bacterium]|nr:1-phosphofructokinase family hexose kinase [Deltaproteobacteria bacterium]